MLFKNAPVKFLKLITILFLLVSNAGLRAIAFENSNEMPRFKTPRAEESYSFLKEQTSESDNFWDWIKFIPLTEDNDFYVSFGGEFRPRFENYTNQKWIADEDNEFYSQRMALHANLQLGTSFRTFLELYHGYTDHKKVFAEYEDIDWHQRFIEYTSQIEANHNIKYRIGRQEIALGSARLVGIREGPNIRRSFDSIRVIQELADTKIEYFYGKEVRPEFGPFDNRSNWSDSDASNPKLMGIYSQFVIPGDFGKNELYLLSFKVNQSQFNDVQGDEERHTIGLRRFGNIGENFTYNSEIMYQFGDHAGNDIKAFNFETDWHYHFRQYGWKPALGLKLEWSTGDDEPADGEVNTFNPMFVNPAYYGLAKTVTPTNIISIHPSITVHPSENLQLYLEWASFERESRNDGLYRVTRFLSREASLGASKDVGEQIGFTLAYQFNRYWSFDFEASYFKAGKFLKESGDSENILHFSPTFRFRF